MNYGKMLYEALRNYYAVNTSGQLTILYKYCACLVQPLQAPFNAYASQRTINALVAECKWQIGQLTNVLNFLYDSSLKRINIAQSVTQTTSAPKFPYTSHTQTKKFGEAAGMQARKFLDPISQSKVIINVPAGVDISNITATIEQIRLQGIPYQIHVF